MSYFSPAESKLPTVEEINHLGDQLQVIIRAGSHRYILDGVVDFRLSVGDEVQEMPRYRSRVELRPRWSPFDQVGVDDDD